MRLGKRARIHCALGLLATLVTSPVWAQAAADAPPQPQAAPQAAELAQRGEALARFLVGGWETQSDEGQMRMLSKARLKADGTFDGTIHVFIRADPTKDIWALAGEFRREGEWKVEDQVLVETTRKLTPAVQAVPFSERSAVRVTGADQFEARSEKSGKLFQSRRLPQTGEAHAAAFAAKWPEPAAIDSPAWVVMKKDEEGTELVDTSTWVRATPFASGWTQLVLGEADLKAARQQADALARSGKQTVVMERGLTYTIVDCAGGIYKNREVRIIDGGRMVGGARFEGSDPLDWSRIGADDGSIQRLRERVCPPAGR